jgi:glyoxylase-like metal-dependent hydrolase (beta-lactamase superfamily II)
VIIEVSRACHAVMPAGADLGRVLRADRREHPLFDPRIGWAATVRRIPDRVAHLREPASGFLNPRFELLDADAEVLPGPEVIATPGHTGGPPVRGRAAATARSTC